MVHMGRVVRDEFNSFLSAINHNPNYVDFSRIMTAENAFDTTLIRAFLIQAFEEDDFDEEMLALGDEFIRGVLSGLSLVLAIERKHGETMGRPSHAEIVDLYDSGVAYLAEKAVR
tara:strand:+ start:120 stop:464 length:345 start_codon:yes stop_codon:yes gene_type:complete